MPVGQAVGAAEDAHRRDAPPAPGHHGIAVPAGTGGGREHPYAHLPHWQHTNVCLAAALGYASRGAPKDRLDVEDRARIALADGITHCLCRPARGRRRSRASHLTGGRSDRRGRQGAELPGYGAALDGGGT